jgi:hypothetical protein
MRHAIASKHKAHGEFSKTTSIHTQFKHIHQMIIKTEMQAYEGNEISSKKSNQLLPRFI